MRLLLDATEPAGAGKWIAARSEPVELAGYLDDWTFVRIAAGRPEPAWRRPVAAARVADPDRWRDDLRSRVGSKDPAALAEYRRLADNAAALEAQPPARLILLARQLTRTEVAIGGMGEYDDLDRAVRVLREAARRHPDDFWLHLALAASYEGYTEFTQPEEAIRHITAAIALRPRSGMARCWLGRALTLQYRLDEAVDEITEAIRIQPDLSELYAGLGAAMIRLDRVADSIPLLRKAIDLKPRSAWAHADLGQALKLQRKFDDADVEIREAIRLQPDWAWPRCELADTLWQRGKFDEASAEYREAIRIAPDFADPHALLARILNDQGKVDEADAEYRKSMKCKSPSGSVVGAFCDFLISRGRLDEVIAVLRDHARKRPDDGWRRCRLGNALMRQGKPDEALAELREAVRLKPADQWVMYSLTEALSGQGKWDEAASVYRQLLERARERFSPADPRTAGVLVHLGLALVGQGKWLEAEPVLRECLAIREKTEPDEWTTFSARSLLGGSLLGQGKYAEAEPLLISGYEGIKARRAKGFAPLEKRLGEAAVRILHLYDAGGKKDKASEWRARLASSDPEELWDIVRASYDAKRFVTAAGLVADALRADPKLGDDRRSGLRYDAARCAARAAAGEGVGDPPPDDDARARFRGQALGWLEAERDAWAKLLDSGRPEDRTTVVRALQHWQEDTDLAGVRDHGSLDKLPAAERRGWQSLWADVEALLKRSRGRTP